MTTCGCSNLTIAYLQHRLYSPVAAAWCEPALSICCANQHPTPHHDRPDRAQCVDRVECSPESLALCHAATPIHEGEARPHGHPEPLQHCPQPSDPPPIYELSIVQAVLTPVVPGSMLDIMA